MATSHQKTVLVVDDELGIRKGIAWVLDEAGFTVVEAANAKEAREIVSRQRPDLVITDIQMPNSDMNGLDLMKNIRAAAGLPVILMTGYSQLAQRPEAREEASALLTKPFRAEVLVKEVCGILGVASPSPTPAADYAFINVDELLSASQYEFDVFSRIRPDKVLLIGKKGAPVDSARLREYIGRGVNIFMRKIP